MSPKDAGSSVRFRPWDRVVAERFFDESGGMQLVIHSPWGARINRAWGLALRKRFCRSFDFELQASATDDGIVLSLGAQHSFPLEEIAGFLQPGQVARKPGAGGAGFPDFRHALALGVDAIPGHAAICPGEAGAGRHPAHARR